MKKLQFLHAYNFIEEVMNNVDLKKEYEGSAEWVYELAKAQAKMRSTYEAIGNEEAALMKGAAKRDSKNNIVRVKMGPMAGTPLINPDLIEKLEEDLKKLHDTVMDKNDVPDMPKIPASEAKLILKHLTGTASRTLFEFFVKS
jgi:hypothetical protein